MAEKQAVTMEDGTVMEFGAKQKLIKDIDTENKQIILSFKNGAQRTFQIPESLMLNFALHGASQKLGDEMAGVPEIDDCVLAVDSLISRLEAGEWTKARTSGGMAGTSVLIQALMRVYDKPVEAIKEFLEGKTQAQKLALRANPKIEPTIKEIEAERAAARAKKNPESVVDTDALLGELG